MAIFDTVTSTLKGGSAEHGKGSGPTEWGKDGGSSGHDKPPAEHADHGGGHGHGHNNGSHGNTGNEPVEKSSFDLTKIAKDLNVESNVHYNEKNYSDKTSYEKDASYKDNGSAVTKEASQHESGGHKGESSSEYKYADKDFGETSHKSEDYSHDTQYNEKTFDYNFSLDKSFDALDTHHDSLLTGIS